MMRNSVAALDGLFAMTRDRIADLRSLTRPTDGNKFGSPPIDNVPGEN